MFGADGPVGLVIEPESVKAVALERVRSGVVVTAFAETEIPASPEDDGYKEALVRAVKDLFEENSLHRDRVVVAFNSSDAVLRQIFLPFEDESRIRKTIKFEIEEALPFPVEDCVADYCIGRKREGRTEVLVAAVLKGRIVEILDVLDRCGVETVAIELDLGAMANLGLWAAPADGSSLIVEIGKDSAKAVVYERGLVFWRAFRIETGSVREVAGKLASELHRSLVSADLDAEPQHLYVSGSHPDTGELADSLSETLGMKIGVVSPPAGEETFADSVDSRKLCSRGAVALGCALKDVGFDTSSINFRQGEFAYKRKFEQLTPAFVTLLSLVLAGGLVWNVRIGLDARHAAQEEDSIYQNAVQHWKVAGVAEDSPGTTRAVASRLKELLDALKHGGDGRSKAEHNVLEEWREWSDRVPGDIGVVLDTINMSQRSITVNGTAESASKAEELKGALNANGTFSFDLPETKRTKDGRTSFKLVHKHGD